jgi:hypothetical protein
MSEILVLMPYFGRWPEWLFLYLETCRYNPTIDWMFFTDCGSVAEAPANVRFVRMSFADLQSLASNKLGLPVALNRPYKLCDLRPAYGKVFEEFLDGYAFWAFGDLDVVYGNLREALTQEILRHDLISFHEDHISGHLCLFRNNEMTRSLYARVAGFAVSLTSDRYDINDELLFPNRKGWSDRQKYLDRLSSERLSIFTHESFSTPFSLHKPWTNGKFRFPKEWTWKQGRLRNDLDGSRGFPYLHFTHWKTGDGTLVTYGKRHWRELRRLVYLTPSEMHNGFVVNCYGFHAVGAGSQRPEFVAPQWKLLRRRMQRMVDSYRSNRKTMKRGRELMVT